MSFLSLKPCSGSHFPQSKPLSPPDDLKNLYDLTTSLYFCDSTPTHCPCYTGLLGGPSTCWACSTLRQASTDSSHCLGMLFPQIFTWLYVSAQVTSLVKPILIILHKIATHLRMPHPPYPVLLSVSIEFVTL